MQLQGMQQTISIGGKSGWKDISTMHGTVLNAGNHVSPDIVLEGSQYRVDPSTDLLVHFNTSITDAADRYTTDPGAIRITHRYTALGSGAGIFTDDGQGMTLLPGRKSFFAPGNTGDSFTIEFWLNPAYAADNEEIISFRSSRRNKKGNVVPQGITCYIDGRKLQWVFTNFFFNPTTFTSSLSLKGQDTLIPEEWHHHMLVFHSSTGLLEYYMDGTLEAVTYATPSGTDDHAPFIPVISSIVPGKLVIGKNFTGFMDELRIEKKVVQHPVLSEFQDGTGSFTTALIDMGRGASSLEKIILDASIPDNSAAQGSYRVYTDFKQTLSKTPPEWKPFIPGTFITEQNIGRYFEIRFNLYANGTGTLSPAVHSIQAVYDKNLPPLAPLSLTAVPGKGSVTLHWNTIGETDIQGYLIYYGTESGVYFGHSAQEGNSPVTSSGNTITLHGLTNGRLYYFSVAAFDKAGASFPGAFSKEVSVRPLSIYKGDN